MAEVLRVRIKSLYGEIAGILSQLPLASQNFSLPPQIASQYNAAVDELTAISSTDYSRFKLISEDVYAEGEYYTSIVRSKVGSLVKRLEEEHDYGNSGAAASSPVIVTVQQNQTLNVNVIPIQQLISSTSDEDLKVALEELRKAIEEEKNPSKASTILTTVMNKSWELFIQVLPYVLEHMGHRS